MRLFLPSSFPPLPLLPLLLPLLLFLFFLLYSFLFSASSSFPFSSLFHFFLFLFCISLCSPGLALTWLCRWLPTGDSPALYFGALQSHAAPHLGFSNEQGQDALDSDSWGLTLSCLLSPPWVHTSQKTQRLTVQMQTLVPKRILHVTYPEITDSIPFQADQGFEPVLGGDYPFYHLV